MNSITDPPTVRLEAFDANGIHCGSASRQPDGSWLVRADVQRTYRFRGTQAAAERWLQAFGAVVIRAETH